MMASTVNETEISVTGPKVSGVKSKTCDLHEHDSEMNYKINLFKKKKKCKPPLWTPIISKMNHKINL